MREAPWGCPGTQGRWTLSQCYGSAHRSLFVVLDSLTCTDGAIGAAAQGWLVRALSLGDVARILEPVLLLLLQPKTQRTSIHCLKQENSAGEHAAQSQLCVPGPRAPEGGKSSLDPAAPCDNEGTLIHFVVCQIQTM